MAVFISLLRYPVGGKKAGLFYGPKPAGANEGLVVRNFQNYTLYACN